MYLWSGVKNLAGSSDTVKEKVGKLSFSKVLLLRLSTHFGIIEMIHVLAIEHIIQT
jgi:hypothetical protein